MAITSCSSELESRPGQTLAEHLLNTAHLCSGIGAKKLSLGDADANKIIAEVAWRVGFTHDLGKATTYFQDYIHTNDPDRKASL